MTNVAQASKAVYAPEASNSDSFDRAAINSESAALARPLAMGSGSVNIGDRTESFDYEARKSPDGVAKVEITGASGQELSPTGRVFSTIGAVWDVARRFVAEQTVAVAATAAGLGLIGTTEKAEGALMLDSTPSTAYEVHSDQYQGSALWIEFTRPNGTVGHASAVRLNSMYGLTAAHIATLNGVDYTINSVGTGDNFLTNPGETRLISEIIVNPNWDSTMNTPDVAIIKFASPLPGPDLAIGQLSINDMVTTAGYGSFGTPLTGSFTQDGARRAWDAPVFFFGGAEFSSDYAALRFSTTLASSIPLNGHGLPGDSGSPGFNSLGELVTITSAQQGNTAVFGSTLSLHLDQIEPWITQNTIVPEPSTLLLLALGAGSGFLLFGRRGSNSVGDTTNPE